MRALGIITASLGAVLAAAATVVGVRSIADVKRYLKMRQM